MPSPHKEKLREEFVHKFTEGKWPFDVFDYDGDHAYTATEIFDFFMSHTISKAELREWLKSRLGIVRDDMSIEGSVGYEKAVADLLNYLK